MIAKSSHLDRFCQDNHPAPDSCPVFDFALPELRYPNRLNCATELLSLATREGGHLPCLVSADGTWTYRDLWERANQIAHVLTSKYGVKPGSRVLLRGFNTPWLVAAWFGVVKAGAVVVTTMPLLRAGELLKLVELTRPVVAVCECELTAALATLGPECAVLSFGDRTDDDLIVQAARMPTYFADVDTAACDVAILAPTSGTTGVPKVTMHYHRDVLAIADTFGKHVVKLNSSDVVTGSPPLAFTFGLGALVVFPLRVGASVVLLPKFDPELFMQAIAKHSVSVLVTAPTGYKALLKLRDVEPLKRLRRCISAGEHLPIEVFERFRERTGLRIINGIGATEMLHVFIASADDGIRPGSTGLVVPGYRAEIQDPDGNRLPDGVPGLLAVQGPTGCRYLNDTRQQTYVRRGWNITGDSYIRDPDGYFWYRGRTDEMIVSSGYNIAAPEVEAAIECHPDVVEAAVVGLPDLDRGMIVHAAVVLREGVTGDAGMTAEIQAFVKATAAPYKYPRSIEFVDALPRTANGKLQRFRIGQEL